jgi:uncharacterized membrane protein
MSTIEKSIEVNVPARTAYNQWTQFEEFPRFMDGVLEVRQLDDKMTHWRTNIGGIEKDFDAEITEQIPDKRIAWRSRSGAPNAGVVTFHPLNGQHQNHEAGFNQPCMLTRWYKNQSWWCGRSVHPWEQNPV